MLCIPTIGILPASFSYAFGGNRSPGGGGCYLQHLNKLLGWDVPKILAKTCCHILLHVEHSDLYVGGTLRYGG